MLQRLDALIIIGAGESQVPFIEKAKKFKLKTVVIDKNPNSPGFKIADIQIPISTYKTNKVIFELEKLSKKYNFVSVICRSSGKALYTAAEISEKFKLKGLSKKIIPIAIEKSELRLFCNKNNLPMPKGIKIKNYKNFNLQFPLPVIVKPDLPIYGKRDITLIHDEKQLEDAIIKACRASENGYAELEEYIEGIDVSSMFIIENRKSKIIVNWDELVGIDKNNNIVGLGVSIPSVINEKKILENIQKIISKFSSLFLNIESLLIMSFRISLEGNIKIIELHADLGGDLIADKLLPKSNSNIDFFEMVIKSSITTFDSINILPLRPTALVYNKSKYNQKDYKNYELSSQDIFFQNKSISTIHQDIFNLFNNSKSISSLPLHNNWMKLYS